MFFLSDFPSSDQKGEPGTSLLRHAGVFFGGNQKQRGNNVWFVARDGGLPEPKWKTWLVLGETSGNGTFYNSIEMVISPPKWKLIVASLKSLKSKEAVVEHVLNPSIRATTYLMWENMPKFWRVPPSIDQIPWKKIDIHRLSISIDHFPATTSPKVGGCHLKIHFPPKISKDSLLGGVFNLPLSKLYEDSSVGMKWNSQSMEKQRKVQATNQIRWL